MCRSNAGDARLRFDKWAGSFGGPIRKNKLFFFLDTKGIRLLIPQNYQVEIPSPQIEAATLAKIDSIIGSTGRLTSASVA